MKASRFGINLKACGLTSIPINSKFKIFNSSYGEGADRVVALSRRSASPDTLLAPIRKTKNRVS
ncbi:MAG: hypothetical protein Q8914_13370, partial [Bacteroidota bacterium]|nr:hypothetical protein [Bacteroidota bacterium]